MKHNAQILVEQGGKKNPFSDEKAYEETHMLHHSIWALPVDIIPIITKAFIISEGCWDATKATKVIKFLRLADPRKFKLERDNTLRGDITHLYIINVRAKGSRVFALPEWRVSVYIPTKKWFDAQIASWEVETNVSSLDQEPANLASMLPYDYMDCIN